MDIAPMGDADAVRRRLDFWEHLLTSEHALTAATRNAAELAERALMDGAVLDPREVLDALADGLNVDAPTPPLGVRRIARF